MAEKFILALVEQVGGLKEGDKGDITVTNLEGSWQGNFPKKRVSYYGKFRRSI